MRRKYFNHLKKEKGSIMITILLILVVVPVLGIALLGATLSNFKLTGAERDFQAVYYIAEAGINQVMYDIGKKVDELSDEILSHEEFFDFLDEYILDKYINGESNPFILNKFEKNFGEFPQTEIEMVINAEDITVDGNTSYSEGVKSYTINSKGKIGRLNRAVNTSVEIVHRIETNTDTKLSNHPAFDYVIYSPKSLKLPNSSVINGDFYSRDVVLDSAGSQIDGNIISETFVDIKGNSNHPRIKGNVYALDEWVNVSTGGLATVEGSIHANGDVTIGSSGTVYENVFSGRDITMNSADAKILGNAHAAGNVKMQSGTSIKQNVYSDGDLKLLNSNSVVYGNVFVGGNIYKENNTYIIGDSQAGGNINEHNTNNINMQIHPNNKPIKPKFPVTDKVTQPNLTSFTADINKPIEVPQSSSNYIIEPGTYGDLFVGGASTVTFKSGDYIFNSIDGRRWGQSLRLDLRDGPINVYSVGNIEYAGPVYVFSEKKQNWSIINELEEEEAKKLAGMVYWETHGSFKLDNSAYPRQWFGTVLADGDVSTGDSVLLIGAYATNKGKFSFGNNPTIIYAPPTDSAAGNSEDNGNPVGENDKGQNIILSKHRIRTINPIREK